MYSWYSGSLFTSLFRRSSLDEDFYADDNYNDDVMAQADSGELELPSSFPWMQQRMLHHKAPSWVRKPGKLAIFTVPKEWAPHYHTDTL